MSPLELYSHVSMTHDDAAARKEGENAQLTEELLEFDHPQAAVP